MASRVDFAVSVTAIFTHVTGEGQANTDSISSDIGKRLGASGSVSGPAYAGTVLSNINVTTATTLVAASSGTKMVYIRNRALTDAGVVSTATLTVLVDLEGIAVLNPGEAMILPGFGSANSAGIVKGTSSSGTLSVEVADID
jgi:energy-converting hydrogenase Eha subunit B